MPLSKFEQCNWTQTFRLYSATEKIPIYRITKRTLQINWNYSLYNQIQIKPSTEENLLIKKKVRSS